MCRVKPRSARRPRRPPIRSVSRRGRRSLPGSHDRSIMVRALTIHLRPSARSTSASPSLLPHPQRTSDLARGLRPRAAAREAVLPDLRPRLMPRGHRASGRQAGTPVPIVLNHFAASSRCCQPPTTHIEPSSCGPTSCAAQPSGAPTSPSALTSPHQQAKRPLALRQTPPTPQPTTTHLPQEDRAFLSCWRPDRTVWLPPDLHLVARLRVLRSSLGAPTSPSALTSPSSAG